MLFRFGKFWKTLFFVLFSWGTYVAFGYEFTLVTILALIYAKNFKDETGLL